MSCKQYGPILTTCDSYFLSHAYYSRLVSNSAIGHAREAISSFSSIYEQNITMILHFASLNSAYMHSD